VNALDAVREGRATPQDQASQAVVDVLDPQPGDSVLDLAAAPGGKATAAAEQMCDNGVVVASDLYPGRARTIARAVERLGLASVVPVVADARQPAVPLRSLDRVLLDAPCSGLGVLRRRPDARWRVRPDDVAQLAALQREMLAAAAATVRPGGRLVYSVCTVAPAETRDMEPPPGFTVLEPPGAPWRRHGAGALLLPADARTDGMFVMVMERDRKPSVGAG
jgi:16S rRNA (cytosine967-C5)-methyltransferase